MSENKEFWGPLMGLTAIICLLVAFGLIAFGAQFGWLLGMFAVIWAFVGQMIGEAIDEHSRNTHCASGIKNEVKNNG